MEAFPYQILPANWKDLGQLRVIENECFPEDAWPLFDLIGVLSFPGIVRFKAEADRRMIGFAAGEEDRSHQIGWISTIGVLPSHRHLGIGSALLTVCEEQMTSPVIQLTVRKSNAAAIGLYEKHGYLQVDVWSKYYAGSEDGVVMQKVRRV